MPEEMPMNTKPPLSQPLMLVVAGVIIATIAGSVGAYLGSFSHELSGEIQGISGALQESGSKGTVTPIAVQPSPEAKPATPEPPKEPPKPALGMLLQLSVGSSVSVPVVLADRTLAMKVTLVSIEKYGTSNFRAKVKSQVFETGADGVAVVKSDESHTFTLNARSFSQKGFDVIMAGYNESAIGIVIDYKAF